MPTGSLGAAANGASAGAITAEGAQNLASQVALDNAQSAVTQATNAESVRAQTEAAAEKAQTDGIEAIIRSIV